MSIIISIIASVIPGLIGGWFIHRAAPSRIVWRAATNRSTGERCRHAWIRVRDPAMPKWLRLTEYEYDQARKRAEANAEDAP